MGRQPRHRSNVHAHQPHETQPSPPKDAVDLLAQWMSRKSRAGSASTDVQVTACGSRSTAGPRPPVTKTACPHRAGSATWPNTLSPDTVRSSPPTSMQASHAASRGGNDPGCPAHDRGLQPGIRDRCDRGRRIRTRLHRRPVRISLHLAHPAWHPAVAARDRRSSRSRHPRSPGTDGAACHSVTARSAPRSPPSCWRRCTTRPPSKATTSADGHPTATNSSTPAPTPTSPTPAGPTTAAPCARRTHGATCRLDVPATSGRAQRREHRSAPQ
jgi:hypothetical protein